MDSEGYNRDDTAKKQLEASVVIVTLEEERVTQTENILNISKPQSQLPVP